MVTTTKPQQTAGTAGTLLPVSPECAKSEPNLPRSRGRSAFAVIPAMQQEGPPFSEPTPGEEGDRNRSRTASGSQNYNRTERRRLGVYPNCAEAMAMLTLRPVFATPVPRFHIEPRLPTGTLTVYDRSSNEHVRVYAPRFSAQFRAGYRAGRWYLRPMTDVGTTPRSPGFRTAREAIAALDAGRWRIPVPEPHCGGSHTPLRVLWR